MLPTGNVIQVLNTGGKRRRKMAFAGLGRVHQNRLGEVGNDVTAAEVTWGGRQQCFCSRIGNLLLSSYEVENWYTDQIREQKPII